MNNTKLFKSLIALALVCAVIVIIYWINGRLAEAGLYMVGFFFLLALGFRGFTPLKRYTYTLMIFSAVSAAMYYPQYFVEYNGFKFTTLITPLIQLIMFGMGTSMSVNDFIAVGKTPKGVGIGLASQFLIMPCLGFTLANLSGFSPEIAAGIILIGCSPSGLASNVMSYLAKANLALSITITSICTLIAPFTTPLLMKLLAGAFIEINVLDMMWDISKMILLPIGLGLIVNRLLRGNSKWLDEYMPILSMLGIALIIVVITAAGRDSLLNIGPLLILLVMVHNLMGYFLGYWFGRLCRLNERDCRTVAIEVGMQNGGLASGIAKEMGKIATVGLAAAVFGPLQNITGSILASYWQKKTPEGYDPLETLEKAEQSAVAK